MTTQHQEEELLRFLFDGTHEEFQETLDFLGQTPLPKFIEREPTEDDNDRYQTIYKKKKDLLLPNRLHFSKQLLKRMEIKGINLAEITLHVGLGTFRSIDVEDLSKHKMDSEEINISKKASNIINTS